MLLVALLFSAGSTLTAAKAPLEGGRVSGIEFEPTGQPLPRAELDRLVPFHPGDPYDAAAIREAIQNLYATGRYTDIAVDASRQADGIAIRFITTLALFIGRVSAEGSPDPPNAGQLVTATKLQLGTEFAANDLHQSQEAILERLRANGLYRAKVTSTTSIEAAIQQINIDFQIDPGPRARFGDVEVRGDPSRSRLAILRSTRWRRPFGLRGWRAFTESRLQNGIENVRTYYQRHDRLLARVTLSNLNYDEKTNLLTPVLTVDPGPLVRVRTEGFKMSGGRLREILPIYQERSLDRSLLVEGQRNLIDYFQSEGYFDADVTFNETRSQDGNEDTVIYDIDRRERHKLISIGITGNHYFDRDTIRERMYLMPSSLIRFPRGRYSQRYLDRDRSAIEDLYRSNGFHDVRIVPDVEDDYRGQKGAISVQVNVEEGPQYLVSKLDIEGIAEPDREYLMSIIHCTPGQPYSEFNVATDRDAVLAYYFNSGYPDATFDWTQTPSAAHRVDLKYSVHPGRREFVRRVVVSGLRATDDRLVQQRIDFGPGDPVSQARIADVQRRLYDLGIFAKVQTAVQNPEGREDGKYVLYQLEEARRYSMNWGFGAEVARIGGGVTTFDAPAGAAGFSPRVSLGISRLNMFGLGHTASLQTRVSSFQKRVLASYFAPQFRGSDKLNLTITTLFDDSRDIRTYAARRLEGSVQLGQRLSRANTLQYRATYRDVFVNPDSVKINRQLIPILSQSVRVGQLSATLITDRRDDPTDAHRGLYQSIDVGYAAHAFGSQTSFLRVVYKNSTYYRLTRDLTFARTTSFGLTDRTGGLAEIPLPERFFSGGAYSNRAFPDNQAGPRDPITGFPLGGTAVLMNSFELRFPLLGDNVNGVLFHDAGNVYSSLSDISFRFRQRNVQDFNYMVHGFGFGIRYRTPIGPIRADISLSPNSPRFVGFQGSRDFLLTCSAPGSGVQCPSVAQRISIFQFHFSLGQAF